MTPFASVCTDPDWTVSLCLATTLERALMMRDFYAKEWLRVFVDFDMPPLKAEVARLALKRGAVLIIWYNLYYI